MFARGTLTAIVTAVAAFCPTARAEPVSVTLKGSDTLVALSHRWGQAFTRRNPTVVVQVSGGGSSTGISALEAGATDIATSSRPLTDDERTQFRGEVSEIAVARDGVAFFVNEQSPIRSLTLEQLRLIFLGDLSSWASLRAGLPPRRIVLYSRENTSGTYAFVKEHVLHDEDFTPLMQQLQGTGAVVNAVSQEPWSIGFGGTASTRGARPLGVRIDGEDVVPSAQNVSSGRYPLSRTLYFYLSSSPSTQARAFVDFVTSFEGQSIASKAGFLPLTAR